MNDDLTPLLLFLWRWKKPILLSACTAALLAGLVASPLVTEPKYEAESVMFATKNNSSERQLREQEFGYDIEADRLIQVLLSNALRDSLIRKFGLATHYEIDTTAPLGREKLRKAYKENINFERTRYMSVAVRVKDADPVLAARVANAVPGIADRIRSFILKTNTRTAFETAEKEYRRKLAQVGLLRDSINRVREDNARARLGMLSSHFAEKQSTLGKLNGDLSKLRRQNNIYEYKDEINNLNRYLDQARFNYESESGKLAVYEKSYPAQDSLVVNTRARMEGAQAQMKAIRADLNRLSSLNQDYVGLTAQLESEKTILEKEVQPAYEKAKYAFEPEVKSALYNSLKATDSAEMRLLNELYAKYERARQIYNEPIPASYVVSLAEPDLLKKSPKIWLVSIMAFLFTGLTAIGVILIWEKLHQVRGRMKEDALHAATREVQAQAARQNVDL